MFFSSICKVTSGIYRCKHIIRKMSTSNDITTLDYLVLGAGSGGIASSRRSTEFGVKAGIIEHGRLGGTCVSSNFNFFVRNIVLSTLN